MEPSEGYTPQLSVSCPGLISCRFLLRFDFHGKDRIYRTSDMYAIRLCPFCSGRWDSSGLSSAQDDFALIHILISIHSERSALYLMPAVREKDMRYCINVDGQAHLHLSKFPLAYSLRRRNTTQPQ